MNPRDRHHLVCTKSRSHSKEWEEMVVQQASKNVWTLSKNSDYTYSLCSAEYLYLFVVWVQFVIWNPASGSLPVSWLFASGGPSIRALASVLLMNIQGWFPLGLTGWTLQWTVSPSESGDTPLPNPPHQVHSQASDLRLDFWAQAFWSAPSSNLFLYFCFICGVARTPNSFIHSFIHSFFLSSVASEPLPGAGTTPMNKTDKSLTSGGLFLFILN